jgi:hypothetical protein
LTPQANSFRRFAAIIITKSRLAAKAINLGCQPEEKIKLT